MAYLKPQAPLMNGEDYVYPVTTADQIILSDGSRLEKDGEIVANNSEDSEKLGGYTFDSLKSYILDLAHPVGSFYWSAQSTNPNTLFGGTWEQIKDTFILAAGDNYSVGDTGGEATHTLTVDEMPTHNHGLDAHAFNWGSDINNTVYISGASASAGTVTNNSLYTMQGQWNATKSIGAGTAHNNMPPYVVAYCWKRTA